MTSQTKVLGALALAVLAYASLSGAAQGQRVATPATASTTETGFVYTADERGNSISIVDLSTAQVTTIPVCISPHNVQVSRDGRLALVVGMVAGVHEKMSGKGAHGVVISDDGNRAFIANSVDNTATAIATETQRVTRTFKVGEGSGGITFRSARQ